MSVDNYARYHPALLRKARRILHNEADALDAVQNVFVAVLENRVASVDLPYLYRLLTHRCLNALRDEQNRARLLSRERASLCPTSRVAPDLGALTLQLLVQLSQRLDQSVLEVVIYRYFDDMGQEEIAALLSISRKTVQNRLARAEELLAELAGKDA